MTDTTFHAAILRQLARLELAAETLEATATGTLRQARPTDRAPDTLPEGDRQDGGDLDEATRLVGQVSAATVMRAFAVEVCLKLIIAENGQSAPDSQDLEHLFAACPAQAQDRIRQAVCLEEDIDAETFTTELAYASTTRRVFDRSHDADQVPIAGASFLRSLLGAAKGEIGA